MAISCLRARREVSSTFYEHCVSFSCVKNYETDGVTERLRNKERWRNGNKETERKMYGVWPG